MRKFMQSIGAMALVLFTMLYAVTTSAATTQHFVLICSNQTAPVYATVYYDVGPPPAPAIQDGTFLRQGYIHTSQDFDVGQMVTRKEPPQVLATTGYTMGSFVKVESQNATQSNAMMKSQEKTPPLALAVASTTSISTSFVVATTWQNAFTYKQESTFANYAENSAPSINFLAKSSHVSMMSILTQPIRLATIAKKVSIEIRI